MKRYIGFKMIQAEPMTREQYHSKLVSLESLGDEYKQSEGYKVVSPDGKVSWSPKDVFEAAYMEISEQCTITQEIVDRFITKVDTLSIGDKHNKSTLMVAHLANGATITEDSCCSDPSGNIEENLCDIRIKNRVWDLLNFLLQTAKYGIRRSSNAL